MDKVAIAEAMADKLTVTNNRVIAIKDTISIMADIKEEDSRKLEAMVAFKGDTMVIIHLTWHVGL